MKKGTFWHVTPCGLVLMKTYITVAVFALVGETKGTELRHMPPS
jgi:hypothetical protein